MPGGLRVTLARFRLRRPLTPDEYGWAGEIFGDTLPPRERILVSPALGLQRRAFTFPGRHGTTMYLGPHQPDPVRSAPGLFAHELTHVWQLHQARCVPLWLARAVVLQVRHALGRDVYGVGDATKPWAAYTVEQQATVVERWATHRDGPEGSRLRHYLDENVRAARTLSAPGRRRPPRR